MQKKKKMINILNVILLSIQRKKKIPTHSYFIIIANEFCEDTVHIIVCSRFLKIFVGFRITLLSVKQENIVLATDLNNLHL